MKARDRIGNCAEYNIYYVWILFCDDKKILQFNRFQMITDWNNTLLHSIYNTFVVTHYVKKSLSMIIKTF